MEFWKKKKKIVRVTALLLGIMLLCTLISKSIYAYQLPQVTAEEAKQKTLGRQIRLSGTVLQSREYAVSTLPAIKVETVEVGKGDAVEEGTLLFKLDARDLAEQIAQQELAVKKLEVQIAVLQYNQELADEKKVRDTDRLLADYLDTAEEKEIAVDRAKITEEEARQDLQAHLEDAPQLTDSEGRAAAWEEYKSWLAQGERLQEEVDVLTKKLAALQKKVDTAQTALDAAQQGTWQAGTEFSLDSVQEGGSAVPETLYDAAEAPDSAAEAPDSGAETPKDTAEAPDSATEVPDDVPETPGDALDPSENAPEDGAAQTPDPAALQSALKAAIAERDACSTKLEAAQEKLQKYQAELKTEPDFAEEDAAQKSWESQAETLRRELESAGWSYEDAQRQKETALKEAQRSVDDSVVSENMEDALALDQLELSWLKQVLEGYRELQKQDGKIIAEKSGIVTAVNVTAGSDTPDGAAVVYADQKEALDFQMVLTKEEKKYIDRGTQGSLQLGNSQEVCAVEYLEQQADGSYLALLSLPEGMGSIGEGGTFTVSWQSRTYPCCVLLNAVYEENQQNYIYVIRRQQGILGEELAAEKRYVTVLERGDSYAALDPSGLAEGEEIIVTSTMALTDGDVIRYRLQTAGSAE